jgi:hypothetical protein
MLLRRILADRKGRYGVRRGTRHHANRRADPVQAPDDALFPFLPLAITTLRSLALATLLYTVLIFIYAPTFIALTPEPATALLASLCEPLLSPPAGSSRSSVASISLSGSDHRPDRASILIG